MVWQFSFPEYIFRCVFAIDYASPLWLNWSEQQKTDVIYGSCAQMTCQMSSNRSYTINSNKVLNDQKSLPWSKGFPKEIISLQSLRQLTSVTADMTESPRHEKLVRRLGSKGHVTTSGPVAFRGYCIQIRKRCNWVFVLPDIIEHNLLIYQSSKQRKEIKALKYKCAP